MIMIVCAHGEVSEYCKNHEMMICEQYTGDILRYQGVSRVLVTDQKMEENEFYGLKLKMLRRGVELISIHHNDEHVGEFINYLATQKRSGRMGRRKFGDSSRAERAVLNRIFELRDSGFTMKAISDDPDVHYPDGRTIPVSTIQVFLRNREKYERK